MSRSDTVGTNWTAVAVPAVAAAATILREGFSALSETVCGMDGADPAAVGFWNREASDARR